LRPDDADARRLLRLFAFLIGQHIERERLLTELKQLNAALASAALTDSLTGLANRRALRDELERALARARRAGSLLLVAFVDLDGFKQINDRHGHDAGDLLLREAARRLQGGLRGSDYLARLGGDEFVVLGDGPELARPDAHGAAVDALRARIEALLQGPVELGPARLDGIGASVGVVVCDPHACVGRAALQAADQAMYGVKALRRAQALA
jgi:diguanylate cyclase